MNKGKIYIIRNRINDKVYIGQTTRNLEVRFSEHMNPAICSHGVKMRDAIFKHGSENFYIELLQDNIPEDALDDAERYWIAEYNSCLDGYNSFFGGAPGEGHIYVSDKMLKYFGIYDILQELKTTQDKKHQAELTLQCCRQMIDKYPMQVAWWHRLEDESIKTLCEAEGVECKFI